MNSALGAEPAAPPLLAGRRLSELTSRQRKTAWILTAVVVAPFVVAAFQAIADRWYPVGDNGTMLTVARQVFTAHTPLTGEVASGTRYGAHPFHPGPMVYYLLAPFVEVFGGPAGLLLGAAFVSSCAIALIGYVALRTAGPAAALWAWVTTLVMCWSLGGTAFLYPPFKTTLSLLVIALFLHLCAALLSGNSTLLPLWVLAASFPMAATVRYALPVAAVAGATLALVLVRRWRNGVTEPGGTTSPRQRARHMVTPEGSERRSVALALLLAVLCWWGPVYEAATQHGGNVRELYRASRVAAAHVDGPARAISEQAQALLFHPPLTATDFRSPAIAYVALSALLLGAVAVAVARQRRRLSRVEWSYLLVALAALGAIFASLATIPSDEGVGIYRTLATSPVGAYLVFTAGVVLAAAAQRANLVHKAGALRFVAVGTVVLGAVLVAVPGPIDPATEQYPWDYEATRTLVSQAEPHLHGVGDWSAWAIGGRTTDTVFIGFKAGLEAQGISTGINSRAPGLGQTLDDPSPPTIGYVLLAASAMPSPGPDWKVIATYEPPGRDTGEADEVARGLAAFARRTHPRLLDAFVTALPRLLCPGIISEGEHATCPQVDEVLASDNPLAELDPGLIALAYLVQFGDDTQYPVLEGPEPPRELLDAARRTWDDVPLTVYVLPTTSVDRSAD